MADLPNRIRELRLAADMSQDALAERVACSKQQISELERGVKPLTYNWMKRISAVLGVKPGELLLAEDNPLNLSDVERHLVEQYRKANEDQKAGIVSVAETLARQGSHADQAA